jgi:CheY-like chemotaxis protein
VDWNIVGEASDGLEAIQKARDLQPDLVLLDVALPKLNGIDAAEQIRIVAPGAKILFLSLESSAGIVQEALRAGAHGYINKLNADSQLVPAVEAVFKGKHLATGGRRCHEVLFYSHEAVFLNSVSRFIAGALTASGAAIVVATNAHSEGLVRRLKAEAFDIDAAIQKGTFVSVNAAEALSTFMVNGMPDRSRFLGTFGSVISSTIQATGTLHPRVAVFGENVGVLCAEGNTSAVIEIEKMCNDLLATHKVDVLCACPLSAFQEPSREPAYKSICAEHTAVFSR